MLDFASQGIPTPGFIRPQINKTHRVLLCYTGITRFYWVLLGFTRVLLGITRFYWVLLGYYWVLLCFTGVFGVFKVKPLVLHNFAHHLIVN